MKLSEMKTNSRIIREELESDPEFRAEWERTALARAVAVAIVRYRADHELSQRDLAQRLEMKQPQVARLELGEVNPTIETLVRISSGLGVEFTIDVRPAGSTARNLTGRAQKTSVGARLGGSNADLSVVVS